MKTNKNTNHTPHQNQKPKHENEQELELELELELDQFIDSLNLEQRPTESLNQDIAELQSLVRKVKGQRPIPGPNKEFSQNLFHKLETKRKLKTTTSPRRHILPWTALVACFLTLFLLFNPWSYSDKNILLAMEQSVEQLQNYHGVLEKISTSAAGESQVIQRVEIWSEGNSYATAYENGTITINNGERRWSVQPQNKEVTLLPIYLDPHDFDLQKEATKALRYPHKIIREEAVAGRSTTRIQITPPGGLPYDLWIDSETHLPIKLQTAMQKSLQTTYTFVTLETNIEIPSSTFAFNPPEGYQLIDQNPDKLMSSLDEAIVMSGLTPLQLSGLSEKPIHFFASPNRIVLDFEDTVIIQSKASTPFTPSPLAALGQVAGRPLEIFPDSLHWQQKNLEIKVKGQRAVEFANQIAPDMVLSQADQVLSKQPSVSVEVDMEIVKNNQQQVDSGSSPWQLDPIQVAFTFASLQISPSGINGDPPINYDSLKVTSNDGTVAIIQISEGPIKTVYAKRLIRQDESGIWTVIGFDPR